jgi:substrate-binding family protein
MAQSRPHLRAHSLLFEYAQFHRCSPEAAGSTEVDTVRNALGGRRITAPSGFQVQIDARTQHLYKPVMIGRITEDSRIIPVSVTEGLVPPDPWSPWLGGRAASAAPPTARTIVAPLRQASGE